MKTNASLSFIISIVLLLFNNNCVGADVNAFKTLTSFRDCLIRKDGSVCFKERALEALDETIMSDKPIILNDLIEIERNPKYHINKTSKSDLPDDISSRNLKLTDILHDKVEEFFKSRVIKFTMAPVVEQEEARKKGGGGGGGGGKGGKGGGYMMMAVGGMACMMAQMFMGKIAFMAGSALILAKVALLMSAIIGLKKVSSSGGGSKEVVYASEGHGGWHRSLEDSNQKLAYRAYTPPPTGY